MVFKCCVPGCKNYQKDAQMHIFPKDQALYYLWIEKVDHPNLKEMPMERVRKSYRVCNVHFGPDAKYVGLINKSTIKKDAIPSLFLPPKPLETDRISSPGSSRTIPKPLVKSSRVVQDDLKNIQSSEAVLLPSTSGTSDLKPGHQVHTSSTKRTFSGLHKPLVEASSYGPSSSIVITKPSSVRILRVLKVKPENEFLLPVVKIGQSVSNTSDLKPVLQADNQSTTSTSATLEGIENNFSTIEDIENDNFSTDETECIKIEYSTKNDGHLQPKIDGILSDTDSYLARNEHSDFILRKEMFKQFVIKIIDEIRNETDLKALEEMFADAVPLPREIQENVKK